MSVFHIFKGNFYILFPLVRVCYSRFLFKIRYINLQTRGLAYKPKFLLNVLTISLTFKFIFKFILFLKIISNVFVKTPSKSLLSGKEESKLFFGFSITLSPHLIYFCIGKSKFLANIEPLCKATFLEASCPTVPQK